MKALVFGLAIGAAIQAWRNFPADGPVSADMGSLLAVVGMIAAYVAGRSRRPAHASASAFASAQAEATAVSANQNHVNVAVVVPGQGAGSADPALAGGMPWQIEHRQQVDSQLLEGMSAEEIASVADLEMTHEQLQSE